MSMYIQQRERYACMWFFVIIIAKVIDLRFHVTGPDI